MKKGKEVYIIGGIFVALIVGSLTGYFFPRAAVKLEFLGSLFFNALYMIIVPLIVASMVVGITALGDIRKLGKTARHTILYFMATSAVAVVIGILVALTFKPGIVSGAQASTDDLKIKSTYTIGEIGSLRGQANKSITTLILAPDRNTAISVSAENLPEGATIIDNADGSALFSWTPEKSQSGDAVITFFATDASRGTISESVTINVTDSESLGFWGMLARIGDAMQNTLNEMIPRNIVSAAAETKVLALIVFSLFFGGVLSSLGKHARPVVQFFEVLNDAIMKLVHLVMYLAPFGVFGIVAAKVGQEMGGFSGAGQNTLMALGWFSVVVLIGLLIHAGLLMGALRWLGERSPFPYLANMSEALGTALGVSSSSATLPVTMECVVEKNKVDQRAASFVLPLGTTINMDGTAMYQAISAIFVCQLFGVPLGIEHYIIIVVTAVLASVGTPGLPQAGIVMMSIVMGSVGVPPEIIAQGVLTILVVDWALDRARTALNVFGDSVGAAVIANTFEFKTAVVRRAEPPRKQASSRRDISRSTKPDRTRTRPTKTGQGERNQKNESTYTPRERDQRRRPSRAVTTESEAELRDMFSHMVSTPNFDLSGLPEGQRRGRTAPVIEEAPATEAPYTNVPETPEVSEENIAEDVPLASDESAEEEESVTNTESESELESESVESASTTPETEATKPESGVDTSIPVTDDKPDSGEPSVSYGRGRKRR